MVLSYLNRPTTLLREVPSWPLRHSSVSPWERFPREMSVAGRSTWRKEAPVGPVVDTHQEILYPLDFSYKILSKFEDAIQEKPRPRNPKDEPHFLEELDGEEAPHELSPSTSLKFNNNMLASWDGFASAVRGLLLNPPQLGWVDLSFNDLRSISAELLEFPNLTVLYLHGNSISKIAEVDKLARLPKLKSLSLYGNDMAFVPGYRSYVVGRVPGLKHLDFSGVTKTDLANAETFKRTFPTKKKKSPTKEH